MTSTKFSRGPLGQSGGVSEELSVYHYSITNNCRFGTGIDLIMASAHKFQANGRDMNNLPKKS